MLFRSAERVTFEKPDAADGHLAPVSTRRPTFASVYSDPNRLPAINAPGEAMLRFSAPNIDRDGGRYRGRAVGL